MCHVLIIEDELLVAMDLQRLLETLGATSVDVADTEEDAIRAARAHAPDLITSDVQLRRGTGPRAVAEIHHQVRRAPVIFITGTPEDCHPCEVGRILSKPLHEPSIVEAFRELAPPDVC